MLLPRARPKARVLRRELRLAFTPKAIDEMLLIQPVRATQAGRAGYPREGEAAAGVAVGFRSQVHHALLQVVGPRDV